MAPLSGTAGSVVCTTGGTVVAGEISEWSFSGAMATVETTAFGDNWEESIPSVRSGSGKFSGNFDSADAAQTTLLNAFLGGSAVALRLSQSATKYINIGTAFVTGLENSISQKGRADIAYNFKVSGPVTFV